LSQGENIAERSPLAIVRDIATVLANTQKKNLRNDGESGCGWLILKPEINGKYSVEYSSL